MPAVLDQQVSEFDLKFIRGYFSSNSSTNALALIKA